MNDLKFAIRQLLKNPGFTAVAVLTLAICLGASLATFAVVDAILIRSLPFPEPDRLVVIHHAYPGAGIERGDASIVNYFDRRHALDTFASVSLFNEYPYVVGEAGSSHLTQAARVTPEFFRTLGVRLAMGREFTDEELDFATDKVAIITEPFWRSYFSADPDVLGRTFCMHTYAITVVGVLPPGFRYLSSRAQIFRPHSHYRHRRDPDSRHSNDRQMIARLASNRSIADAQAQLNVLDEQLLSTDPMKQAIQAAGYQARVSPLHQDYIRAVTPMLLLVQAGALCRLLMGVANIAGLWLIRASGQSKEIAVRQALGASRGHIARGILAETLLLSLVGGALTVGIALAGVRVAGWLGTDTLPLVADITFDGRVAVTAILVAIVVGVSIALPLLWLILRDSTSLRLQSETRAATTSRGVQQWRHGFIVAQIVTAIVLLYGAGLLGLSLKRTLEKSPGFSAEQVLTAELILPWANYPTNPSRVAFVQRLQDRLRELPGVTHAAVSSGLPFTSDGSLTQTISPTEAMRSE